MIEFERDNVTRVDFRRRQRIPDDPMYSELDALHQGAAQFWESGHELTVFIDDLHYQEDITDQERQVLLYWLGQTIGIIPISAQTRMTVQKQFVEDLETLVEQELDFWDGLTDGMKAILGTNRLMLVLDQVHSISEEHASTIVRYCLYACFAMVRLELFSDQGPKLYEELPEDPTPLRPRVERDPEIECPAVKMPEPVKNPNWFTRLCQWLGLTK
jgi:hypothetical protein